MFAYWSTAHCPPNSEYQQRFRTNFIERVLQPINPLSSVRKHLVEVLHSIFFNVTQKAENLCCLPLSMLWKQPIWHVARVDLKRAGCVARSQYRCSKWRPVAFTRVRIAVFAIGQWLCRWYLEEYGPKCQCLSLSMSRFSFCVNVR